MRWFRLFLMTVLIFSCAFRARADTITQMTSPEPIAAMQEDGALANEDEDVNLDRASLDPLSMGVANPTSVTPEPSTLLLLGTGMVSVLVLVLRQRFRIHPEAIVEAQIASGLPSSSVAVAST